MTIPRYQNEFKPTRFLETIFSLLPGNVYWKDNKGRCLFCNDNVLKVFGFNDVSEYTGKTDLELTDNKEIAKITMQNDKKVIESGKRMMFEERAVDKNGKEIIYLTEKIPLVDDNNKVTGLLGISIDITKRKAKEDKLTDDINELRFLTKKQNDLLANLTREVTGTKVDKNMSAAEYAIIMKDYLEGIIARMPGHVYWSNKDNVFLGCNDRQAKSDGLKSRKEIIGKTNYNLPYGEEFAEKWDAINNEIMRTGKNYIDEETVVFADGREATYISEKVPLRDRNNNIIGVLGISMDITEHKKKEAKLAAEKQKAELSIKTKDSLLAKLAQEVTGMKINKKMSAEEAAIIMRDYLEGIIARMPGHVFWLDRNNIILGCNDLQAKDTGLKSRKEIIGKTNYDLTWKEQAEELNAINDEIMRTGKKSVREESAILANGRKAVFLSEKAPLRDKEDKIIGVLGISIDITEHKRQEQELKEAKIKSKVQEDRIQTIKSTAAGIAHELRTPIRSIMASAEGIENFLPTLLKAYDAAKNAGLEIEQIYPQHEKLLRDAVKRLEYEGAAANTVVDMLLMNIREINVDESKFKILSIGDCINTALHRYPFQQKERQLVHWEHDNDFKFKGDDTLVMHIIFNLMKNALYYIARAGKGEIFISLKNGTQENQLIFRDTGAGIAADILPHIFEKFFTNTEHGTGIGLSFCKMAMQRMNGDITCTSREGEFTEFCLSFPVI
ncbi:MAG: PAS domain-containing protein [Gammaproteobacteria bacterium]|jgi:PAS domain S-box-containing protein